MVTWNTLRTCEDVYGLPRHICAPHLPAEVRSPRDLRSPTDRTSPPTPGVYCVSVSLVAKKMDKALWMCSMHVYQTNHQTETEKQTS